MADFDVTHCVPACPLGAPLAPGVDPDRFRSIMSSLLSGVAIVTSIDTQGCPCGLTCSAVCSVSLTPPLLLFCVKTPSSTLNAILNRGAFVVSLLDVESHSISESFARPGVDKFRIVPWRPAPSTGMPLIEASVAYTECIVHQSIAAGDHVIVVGRVIDGAADPARYPLGYWRRGYFHLLRSVDFVDDADIGWIGEL